MSIATAAVLVSMLATGNLADSPAVLEVGTFSAAVEGAAVPPGWQPLTFDDVEAHTEYALVGDEGAVVLKAHARASGSGLVCAIRIDLRDYPTVRWRWKIANVLDKAEITRKEGDDVPARLLIFFEYDPAKATLAEKAKYKVARVLYGTYPPHSGISYLWESRQPVGSMSMANSYFQAAVGV